MTADADLLRKLHRIHRQLADLRDRASRGPRQVKVRQVAVANAQSKLQEIEAALRAAQVKNDEKHLNLKSSEDKIESWQGKLNTSGSNKEYQTLKDQIAAAEMANSVLADEILEGLEEIDQFVVGVEEAKQGVELARKELESKAAAVEAEQGVIAAEMSRLSEELKAAEVSLPADFRDAYQRLVKAKGEDGMAPVNGEACAGCSQFITPNMHNELAMGRVVFCKSCGRMLYLPESQASSLKSPG